jgi:hypothetical protein
VTNTEPGAGSSFFWGVDFPGLTKDQADWLIRVVDGGPFDLHGIAADPARWFSVRVDRDGAEVIYAALGHLTPNETADGLREVVAEWLEFNGRQGEGIESENTE